MTSFANKHLCIYDLLGGADCFDFHPTEPTLAYDGGSFVMLWDTVEDIKVRVHE